jgi:glycosyltransferase involved in cell wall biosynthesis
LLLDVWQRLIVEFGEATPRLELIGRWGVASDSVRRRFIEDPHLARFVSVHTACSDDEIAQHLKQSLALLAPSRAEGFGLPVVEALKLGVPVIASDLPSFREGGSDIPTYLAPDAVDDWHSTISSFVHDGPERRRQLAALPHYRAPTWDDHFIEVDRWLRNLPPQLRIVAALPAARPEFDREPEMLIAARGSENAE